MRFLFLTNSGPSSWIREAGHQSARATAPAPGVPRCSHLHPKCSSGRPDHLGRKNRLARPVVDVEELEMPIGNMRGDQVYDDLDCAGQPRVRAGEEAQDLPRVVGVELGLDWPVRARL